MPNEMIRAVLQGHEARIFDLMFETATPKQISSWLATPLEYAAKEGDAGLVTKLLGAGVKANGNVLHRAIEGGHENVVSALLLSDPQLSNYRNTNNELPIFVAVERGRVDILGLLLMNGAQNLVDSLNYVDNDLGYRSALHLAVNCGHLAAVKILLEAEANVDLRGKDSNMIDITPLQLAARDGRIDIMNELLAHGASLDDALYSAVEFDQVEALERLLQAGADIEGSTGVDHCMPLHAACFFRSVKCVLALLKRGARTEATNRAGATPLHIASWPKPSHLILPEVSADVEIVDMLLRWGADETATDDTGKTPEERLTKYLLEEEDDGLDNEDEIFDMIAMLACAPADRSWRRRGMLILCRAYPERVQRLAMFTEPSCGKCEHSKLQRMDADDGGGREANAGGAGGEISDGRDFWWAATWVLGLKEEGLFRKILTFL